VEYESIQKIYKLYSGFYDLLFKQIFFPRQEYAISQMDIKPGDKVLDVGIGTGLTLGCYPKDCHVTGIDLSAAMLKKAHHKKNKLGLDNVTLLEMDACELAFDDNQFDHVISTFVLTVVPDPVKALSEMKRVCKKGNSIVFINHFASENKFLAWTEDKLDPLCRKLGWRNTESLSDLSARANLEIASCTLLKKFDLWPIVFATNNK